LDRVELQMMEDGTAIGSAITTALSRLEKSDATSKIIILLTDGVNNHGKIDPLSAAKAAKALGVKIYTIGAGTNGLAPFPVQDIWGRQGYQNVQVEIDEETLKTIAQITGGRYFRATDTDSLRQVYHEIDKLEKTKIEETGYREYKELFGYFLILALVFLLLALVLENTVFLKLP
jgi:Ca-activated chloride channel family protein